LKIAIILLNFNSYQDTYECVESIIKTNESNYQIFIVDNASQDDSYYKLKKDFSDSKVVSFLASKENLGFSGGCNIGIKEALHQNFDYVLLLNNDTIVTNHFLTEMLSLAEYESNIGIVGGKTLFNDDRKSVWDAGGYICEKSFRGIRRRENHPDINKVNEVGFVTCCLALVKAEVFTKIGLLPEAYFFGSEEWEFSLRAKRAGYKLMYTPKAIIYHKVGRSHDHTSAKMLYNTYRNRILFVKRNFSKTSYKIFMFKFLGLKLLQKLLNRGQLKQFSFNQALFILSETLKDGIKYNHVTKAQWNKFK
jgi:GT2 family glycosyltransferase